ncbi:hypothetical protein RI834_003762 [Pluralibacter gergoviae]|nr:hypothetical protein [Pluralibacter gergoviae]HBR1581517.1 hypothetical protein [Klebsiella pneumoniae]HBV4274563.1 hypothetical protein [Klebsiella pneumoniae]HBV4303000.1 hypothetical protein [Klebsiella pneumoniae]
MNLKIQQHVYAGLLEEAKRRGTTVPNLARKVLEIAAHLFDNGEPLPALGNIDGDNNDQKSVAK